MKHTQNTGHQIHHMQWINIQKYSKEFWAGRTLRILIETPFSAKWTHTLEYYLMAQLT